MRCLVFAQYTQKTRDKQGEVNGGLDSMNRKSLANGGQVDDARV
jgi:hypothetical protein